MVYDRSRAWFRPVSVQKYSGPRPVTNLFSSHMNAFCATLARIEPTLTFRPATDDPEDRATAEVAHRAIEVCEDECDVRNVRQELSQWVGYTGGAWLESGYDPRPSTGCAWCRTMRVRRAARRARRAARGRAPRAVAPPCPRWTRRASPSAMTSRSGACIPRCARSSRCIFDAAHTNWKTGVREYGRKKSSDRVTLERRWGKDAVEGVTSDTGLTVGEAYQDQLPTLAGYQPEIGPGAGLLSRTGLLTQRISEFYYWALPTDDYPEGVLAVVLGGTEGRAPRPLPYADDAGKAVSADGVFPDRSRAGLALQQNARG